MTDFVSNLARRALRLGPAIRPRPPALFEPSPGRDAPAAEGDHRTVKTEPDGDVRALPEPATRGRPQPDYGHPSPTEPPPVAVDRSPEPVPEEPVRQAIVEKRGEPVLAPLRPAQPADEAPMAQSDRQPPPARPLSEATGVHYPSPSAPTPPLAPATVVAAAASPPVDAGSPPPRLIPARPLGSWHPLPAVPTEAVPARSDEPPPVRIIIGRIDVRAVPPPLSPPPARVPPARRSPRVSLEDYLTRGKARP